MVLAVADLEDQEHVLGTGFFEGGDDFVGLDDALSVVFGDKGPVVALVEDGLLEVNHGGDGAELLDPGIGVSLGGVGGVADVEAAEQGDGAVGVDACHQFLGGCDGGSHLAGDAHGFKYQALIAEGRGVIRQALPVADALLHQLVIAVFVGVKGVDAKVAAHGLGTECVADIRQPAEPFQPDFARLFVGAEQVVDAGKGAGENALHEDVVLAAGGLNPRHLAVNI